MNYDELRRLAEAALDSTLAPDEIGYARAKLSRHYPETVLALLEREAELISIIGDAERAANLGNTRLETCDIEAPDVAAKYTGLMEQIREAGLSWDHAGILRRKDRDDTNSTLQK